MSAGGQDRAAARAAREMQAISAKLAAGATALAGLAHDGGRGATAKAQVHALDGARLYRFQGGARPQPGLPPLLLVYALVNRHYMLDLEAERSFVGGLLEAGRDVYLVDWGYPGPQEAGLGLDDYVGRYLHGFVTHLCARAGCEAVDLLGVCQGGTLSLCYAALEPARVRRLALMVTPVDFHAEGFLLSRWLRYVDVERLVATLGNVPGSMLNQAFLALKPLSLSGLKALELIELLDNPAELATFARMEHWLQDSPDQAGRAFAEFVQVFFRDNALVRGRARIGDRDVDLAALSAPVLSVHASRDHIVPPAATAPLAGLLRPGQCTACAFDGGHIGVFASRRARRQVPGLVCEWLAAAARDR